MDLVKPLELIDAIDWASLTHAYGPATDVPDLLQALISHDPQVRQAALEEIYGSVLHQGTVYEASLACVPFLLAAVADPSVPGRAGLVELLAGIVSGDDDEEGAGDVARRRVPGGDRLFLRLLADPDPLVRLAAIDALPPYRDQPDTIIAVLRRRLRRETDMRVRVRLVEMVGDLAPYSLDGAEVKSWLADTAAGAPDPDVRMAALRRIVFQMPGALPPGVVPVVLTAQPRDAVTCDFIEALDKALDDRVAERIELITGLLRDPDPDRRIMAIEPAEQLVNGWRADYRQLVELLGAQLVHPDAALAALSAGALLHMEGLATPATDALAAYVAAAPKVGRPRLDQHLGWIVAFPDHPPFVGVAVMALARLHDPRALPALRWALEREELPLDIGKVVGAMGPVAAELVPALLRRLRNAPQAHRAGLVDGLGALGEAASEAVPDLIALSDGDAQAVAALGRMGAAADEAAPALRRLLDHSDPAMAHTAATALWRIRADPGPLLALSRRLLAASGTGGLEDAGDVAVALAELGPAAAPLADPLRSLLDASLPPVRVHAAAALWRATGEVEATLPVLLDAWEEDPSTRTTAAHVFGDMGSAAARALPLVRAELTQVRRHNNTGNGFTTDTITTDEALLSACEQALSTMTPT
ncbi:HEAT repeat domain-containing protein [Nonomuraea wenchangensis]